MDATADIVRRSGRLFMYAEDWIYAPAVSKTAEFLRATRDKVLFMKGEESHSGSHAAHAAHLLLDPPLTWRLDMGTGSLTPPTFVPGIFHNFTHGMKIMAPKSLYILQ